MKLNKGNKRYMTSTKQVPQIHLRSVEINTLIKSVTAIIIMNNTQSPKGYTQQGTGKYWSEQ